MKTFRICATALFGLAVFLFIITFSIALPIYCRFFYYLHINALELPAQSGVDYNSIKAAYDEVLNYLTLPNAPFGTGVFRYSADGAAHFADCKVLFNLNAIVLICSSLTIWPLFILDKKGVLKLYRPKGFSVAFFSAIAIFIVFFVLAIVVAIDFDAAFTTFHHLFFPGKDNWTFNSYYDQIITVLPQQFFMNCAILIVSSIIVISLSIIAVNLVKRQKNNKKY